ncbi:MAG: AraC family transcriptional regulator [Lachnospiraceae bacterium]|nr:AraC family transcriptional regulator [Lachnospiraceae bacterium]
MANIRSANSDFSQPFGNFISRKLESDEESIDYLPGYLYRIWHNDQATNFPDHKHQALEIILCSVGTYTITIGEEVYKLHEGDILFIPPMAVHSITAPEEGERFILLFDISFFDIFKTRKEIMTQLSKARIIGINNTAHLYPSVFSSINKIIRLYFSYNDMSEAGIYAELLKILCDVSHSGDIEDEEDTVITHSENYNKFVRVLTYIENNYSEDLTLEEIANTAGFSKFHFSRLFKQYTDSTFYDYLCSKRILEAKKLLASNMPVTDVAFQVGFNNLTTFCRCFKKYTDCSPTQYKGIISKSESINITPETGIYHNTNKESADEEAD